MVTDILKGKLTDRIQQMRFDQLSVFGIEKELTNVQIRDVIHYLTFIGAIKQVGDEYPTLALTPESRPILFEKKPVMMPVYKYVTTEKKKKKTVAVQFDVGDVDEGLYQALRATRTRLAKEQKVPPFMIFSDKALQDMAIKQPTTEAAFLDVHGVGQKKAERLGTAFLGTIREYCS